MIVPTDALGTLAQSPPSDRDPHGGGVDPLALLLLGGPVLFTWSQEQPSMAVFNLTRLNDLLSKQREKIELTFGKTVAKGVDNDAKKEMAEKNQRDCPRELRDPDGRA
jgi:hypothetical protein